MPSDGTFSFQVGDVEFAPHEYHALASHVRGLNGEAPAVCLLAGGKPTVSLTNEKALTLFAGITPNDDPVVVFLQQAYQ